MGTLWQCPYCGAVHKENIECCAEMHCFEFDEEKQCPACGSGDTDVSKSDTPHGECIYLSCNECGEQWNHG